MRVDVRSHLRAHSPMRTEAPPEPWTPDVDGGRNGPFVTAELEAAAAHAGAVFGYTRSIAGVTTVVVWFRRSG